VAYKVPPVTARSLISASAAVLAAFALGACGAGDVIDDQKAQLALTYDIERATGEQVKSVTCPSDVPVSVGTRFNCRVIAASGDEAVAEMEITATNGNLRVLSLKTP
jgi:hypothetical protein